MTTTETTINTDTVTKVVMQPPKLFNVILFNDDKTSIEFVILILMTIFNKTFEEANFLTTYIHENGMGIAGTYSFEIASQKQEDTSTAARLNGFPLKCVVRPV